MEKVMEQIDKYIEGEELVLTFTSQNDAFHVKANDYVDVETLCAVVDEIALKIKLNDFDYSLYDVALAYFVIDLFTDIPIPMVGEGESQSPDYAKCYAMYTRMGLLDELCAVSNNIENSIAFIEKNVWRKLEYYKTMESNSALTMVCGKLYDILDGVENIVDKVADVDIKALAAELDEVSNQLAVEAAKKN